ncbi:pentatricopeptide repeat-containing protein At4g18520, chloroplastic-like [Selaginella moellendorffii]|uniref:pentatricopeptide repeat-containing protein At4g18520, chloroplastic-like n=1 Tax=Selaginella moellendorffii TaxID=88036 RepID=UPI000D1C4FFB|nr:pentatricopeptide repeat-containing protein At4g18520, chloroplastic-like [Selaginella moellendorffii]|eukprot:XP_024544663.1 pentatricopeptide repeat-containing protein At4g18520, chloroplastic-like [Selaginella moellendorffii]
MIEWEWNLFLDAPSWSKISIQKVVLAAIRASTRSKDLNRGKQIHAAVAASCDRLESRVASSLIAMYSRCGSVIEARAVFDDMDSHDVVSWTAIILGYVQNGDAGMALELFERMLAQGVCDPDARVYVAAIKACAHLATKEEAIDDLPGRMVKLRSLERGMALHSQLARKNWDVNNVFVASSLVTLYRKCGAMVDAWRVFKRTIARADAAMWNSLLLGYAENGEPQVTLDLLLAVGAPDRGTYAAALKACSYLAAKEDATKLDGFAVKLDALEKGMAVHSQAGKDGFKLDATLANTLIDTYANCGGLVDAKRVFDRLPDRDTVSWTALILGYAENGESKVALQLFETMQQSGGCVSDHRVFIAAAKACTDLAEKAEAGELFD